MRYPLWHRITNYRRTGRPWLDFRAHVHRLIVGHYDASNNPSVRRWKHCSCNKVVDRTPWQSEVWGAFGP